MATLIASSKLQDFPNILQESTLSTIPTGNSFTIALMGPSGRSPYRVLFTTTTKPTDGSDVKMSWTSSSSTNDTITVFADAQVGGSLTGAVVQCLIEWHGVGSGGISA